MTTARSGKHSAPFTMPLIRSIPSPLRTPHRPIFPRRLPMWVACSARAPWRMRLADVTQRSARQGLLGSCCFAIYRFFVEKTATSEKRGLERLTCSAFYDLWGGLSAALLCLVHLVAWLSFGVRATGSVVGGFGALRDVSLVDRCRCG